jgi:DNA-binding MarR family transcriptional regulator
MHNEMGLTMIEDVVRELGFLTLGSRLKRIGERLQAQTQELLQDAGIEVPASHFPLLAALDRLGTLSVGGISQALGTSQPGVTRQLARLQAIDLVTSAPSPTDQRQRASALTKSGRQLVARAKRSTWPAVEAAVADACGQGGRTLLAQLTALELALAAAPLRRRSARLRARGGHHASA